MEILWPNGTKQVLKNLKPNQSISLQYTDKPVHEPAPSFSQARMFTDITDEKGIDYRHEEDEYNDFEFEPLLPHRYSRQGPGLAVGDVNGDDLDDFFIGNSTGASAKFYLQQADGTFQSMAGPWEKDYQFEDTGALLFDIDNDNDLDLYVVNGGNQKLAYQGFYQDRLYVNTDTGFVKTRHALPEITSSGSSIIPGDFDADGDMDLFIGGRIVPGKYPYPAQSYILRNEGGKDLSVRYVDITSELAPTLQTAGLVTAAIWDDFDLDGKLDLILTGEWMSIRFLRNTGTQFEEVSTATRIQHQHGWWHSLQKADIDADGDMDYIAGNLGLNYKYQAHPDKPFEVYANDFDENGTTDIVLSHQKQGTLVPLRGRECSSQQVPAIKTRFKTFELFADASLADIYGQQMLDKSLHYQAHTFAHVWIENQGNGQFQAHPLPNLAQISSINTIQVLDYNQDEYPDLLLAGNSYYSEVETPRADASLGLILLGSKSGAWEAVSPEESGIMLTGEVKQIHPIGLANGHQGWVVARNDLPIALLCSKIPLQ